MSASVMLPVQQRAVLVVTPDTSLRQALSDRLADMRWEVSAVSSGAEVMMHVERVAPEAMIVDHWLPDLDAEEFC
ncbi:MAG: sigma-54-dependent Fis family transcriptional regulator, partial [Terriglobus sp.]